MKKITSDSTLREWSQHWMLVYVKPVAKPSGYEHYYDNLHKHILPRLGDISLSKLTTPTVQEFLNDVSEHGNLRTGGPLSPKSVKNMRVVLDVCCKRAVADGYMPANPVAGTVYKRCPSKRVEVMTDTDQKVLEEFLFKDLSLQDAGIIQALYSGMRLGEVCALRWRQFDPRNRCIHIRETVRRISTYSEGAEYGKRSELVFSDVKTEASKRTLYLPDILMSLFSLQYSRFSEITGHPPRPEDFVFYNAKGSLMDPDNLSHYFGDVLDGLGLPHVKFHALRHTFATRAVEKKIDVATVSGLLGHADVTTTTHYYIHPREDPMRLAMSSFTPIVGVGISQFENFNFGNLTYADPNYADTKRICRRRKKVEHTSSSVL